MMRSITVPFLGLLATLATAAAAPAQGSTSAATSASPKKAHPAVPPSGAHAASGDVKVNEFMSYDSTTKTVKLQIQAGLDGVKPPPKMGPFNFNGGSLADQTVTVPVGWTVQYHFVNHDAVPHSFIIIAPSQPLPMAPETPAIPRAYSDKVTEGLFTEGTSDGNFRASKAGTYLLYCGVPGHGPSGMYINFVVSADAKSPSYTKG
ncbi:MAG TPA: sulfocyanin-like copper-binding protein [Gemmatimonadaceae bacterium]|nr:sulfocyanin-like copper-binding protein [Gemmatimonadaceae bacterium]